MKIHLAKRKDHRCSECGRKIPIGSKYWSNESGTIRQHTNYLLFEDQPLLPEHYNDLRGILRSKK